MLSIHPSENRGLANFGWHSSHYTFMYGTYDHSEFRGFGALRVLNEHHVMPGEGFATRSHRNMEILSYVIRGSMAVRDSTGREVVVRAGEMLGLSAGTGVVCRESNASAEHPLAVIQLWIVPERPCLGPGYDKRPVPIDEKPNRWCLVGSRDGRSGSLMNDQDVDLYMAKVLPGHDISYATMPGRQGWIQVISGSITLNEETLRAGDGASFESEVFLNINVIEPANILLVDLHVCNDYHAISAATILR